MLVCGDYTLLLYTLRRQETSVPFFFLNLPMMVQGDLVPPPTEEGIFSQLQLSVPVPLKGVGLKAYLIIIEMLGTLIKVLDFRVFFPT